MTADDLARAHRRAASTRCCGRGFVEEALRIGAGAVAADAVGYPHAFAYANGACTAAELRALLARETRRYARRQRTWFRSEPGVTWIERGAARRRTRSPWRGNSLGGAEGGCMSGRDGAQGGARPQQLQDAYLAEIKRQAIPVVVYLVNGFQLRGTVRGYDSFTIVLEYEHRSHLIYKHAVSTISPQAPVAAPLADDGESEPVASGT